MSKKRIKTPAHQMWGGRFDQAPDDIMVQINASIDVDKRLYKQDIRGSIAHVRMLAACGILKRDEAKKIENGLVLVLKEIESGKFTFKIALEDVHMNIEARLKELIGDVAGKLHTARSRNDQVATDFRLWVKDAITEITGQIESLVDILRKQAEAHKQTIMPGFTHLQIAQPLTLALHLRAYADMLARDKGRFEDALERMDECPLGACALAGTSYPTDRNMTAKELGFKRPVQNTLDAVSSRDFVLEFLSACAICSSHLSRFAEELVLWSTTQFGFITLSDRFTTGSSIMPQKKNPDAAELVRGKSGRVVGNLMQMLTVMKGLPLAYNKDMQEDKESAFDSFDTLVLCLKAMTGMLTDIKVHKDRLLQDAENGYSTATDLADWLVTKLGMPFRDAHHVTGQIVKLAETQGKKLDQLSLADMQSIEKGITRDVYKALSVAQAVKNRKL
jgi:argininosuccinate lyase